MKSLHGLIMTVTVLSFCGIGFTEAGAQAASVSEHSSGLEDYMYCQSISQPADRNHFPGSRNITVADPGDSTQPGCILSIKNLYRHFLETWSRQISPGSGTEFCRTQGLSPRNETVIGLKPNPAQESEMDLFFSQPLDNKISVMVFNIYGKQVYWREILKPGGLVRIRTGVPGGVYAVVISGPELYFTRQVIVHR